MHHAKNQPEYNFSRDVKIATGAVIVGAVACYGVHSYFSQSEQQAIEASAAACGENIEQVVEYYQTPELTLPLPSESISFAEAEAYAADITALYEVPVTFQVDTEKAHGRSIAAFDPTEESTGYAAALNSAADGLRQLPPEVLQKLGLDEIRFTGPMKGVEDGYGDAAGLYVRSENDILIAQSKHEAGASVVLHELTHALDHKLLCKDGGEDTALAELTSVPYKTYEEDQLADIYTGANDQREFAWTYGATDAGEDRATIMQLTFYERGLILPGDSDYGSPLRAKQTEIVDRLEQLTPGITTYLESRTEQLRERYYVDANQQIPNPFKEGKLSSPLSIAAYAYLHDQPLTQLRGITLHVHPKDAEPFFIADPIIIQDKGGKDIGVLWTEPAANTLSVKGLPYQSAIMTPVVTGQLSTLEGLLDTTATDGDGFLETGISIDGVFSRLTEENPLPFTQTP